MHKKKNFIFKTKKKSIYKSKKRYIYSYNKVMRSKLFSKSLKESRKCFPLFLKTIFKSFIKSGGAYRSYKFLSRLCMRIKAESKLSFFNFMQILYKKVLPVLTFKNKHMGKVKYKLPFKNVNLLKQTRIVTKWAVTSIKENKNLKFSDKLSDEILLTLKNSGGIIAKKKAYYVDFFKNRNNIRFLRYIKK